MASLQRALRRAGQAALCVSALAGGAAIAHQSVSASRLGPIDVGVFPEPMTPTASARSARAVTIDRAPAPAESPVVEEETAPQAPAPLGPFAEPLGEGMIVSGRTPHRLILFTFDDGPDPRNTPRLLDALDAVGVKAVFFLTASRLTGRGRWPDANRALARETVARGHLIGNHTLDHQQLPLLDDAGVAAQLGQADAIFERVLGGRTWLVRPPGGSRSPRVDGLIAARGYTQLLWNIGTGDFQVRSAEDVVRTFRRVLERREREGDRGGIVLMHDTHAWSVEAFPMLVSFLRDRNCELLEQGEELFDIVDDPALFFVARGDAGPSAESAPARLSPSTLAERQDRARETTHARCTRLAQR